MMSSVPQFLQFIGVLFVEQKTHRLLSLERYPSDFFERGAFNALS